jgi:hypothetical protein
MRADVVQRASLRKGQEAPLEWQRSACTFAHDLNKKPHEGSKRQSFLITVLVIGVSRAHMGRKGPQPWLRA